MQFYSTNKKVENVDLAGALLQGQAGDRGLYMPVEVPALTDELKKEAKDLPYPRLAAAVLNGYSDGVFEYDELLEICEDA